MTDKESTNCRMEANYSHQQELDMIPLMLTGTLSRGLQAERLAGIDFGNEGVVCVLGR